MLKNIDKIDLTKKGIKKYSNILKRLHGRVIHSRRRAKSRYGVTLTEFDYFKLVEQILNNEAKYMKPARNPGAYFYTVFFNGIEMVAVYEPAYAMICTFLTKEMTCDE